MWASLLRDSLVDGGFLQAKPVEVPPKKTPPEEEGGEEAKAEDAEVKEKKSKEMKEKKGEIAEEKQERRETDAMNSQVALEAMGDLAHDPFDEKEVEKGEETPPGASEEGWEKLIGKKTPPPRPSMR